MISSLLLFSSWCNTSSSSCHRVTSQWLMAHWCTSSCSAEAFQSMNFFKLVAGRDGWFCGLWRAGQGLQVEEDCLELAVELEVGDDSPERCTTSSVAEQAPWFCLWRKHPLQHFWRTGQGAMITRKLIIPVGHYLHGMRGCQTLARQTILLCHMFLNVPCNRLLVSISREGAEVQQNVGVVLAWCPHKFS